jgi:tRNA A-37 threonylcarbamoyl transferase component Bud32
MASQFLASPAVEQLASPNGSTRTDHLVKDGCDEVVDVLAILAPAEKPGLMGKLEHYEVLEVVGQGAMGIVVKAFDPKLHRVVAIKLMARHLAANSSARRRFEREARAVAAVRNEHVVAIFNVEPASPIPYLVMEFIGGISLQERLEQRGPLEVKEILRIGMQVAQGLAAAHAQGLVHRDVKPANILLENGVERVKITDFGLARAIDDVNLTQSGVITGTPNYMSPEQADGRTVDHRSDLFSLGSVLYALATGHPPFRANGMAAVLKRVAADLPRPVREINPDIPDWLEEIIQKLHAKEPAKRFQSAQEVAELLGQHLAHLQQPTVVPRPAKAAGAAPSPASPRRIGVTELLATHLGLTILIAVTGLVVGWWKHPASPDPWMRSFLAAIPLGILWFAIAARLPAWIKGARERRQPAVSVKTRWLLLALALGLAIFQLHLLLEIHHFKSGMVPTYSVVGHVGLPVLILGCLYLAFRRRTRANTVPEAGRETAPVNSRSRRGWIVVVLIVLGLAILVLFVSRGETITSLFDRGDRPPSAVPVSSRPDPTGFLKVVQEDPSVHVLVANDAQSVSESSGAESPGRSTRVWRLPHDTRFHLHLRRGESRLHTEVFRLQPGETREIHIPKIETPHQTITLVPKAGRFPTDVTRMLIAPDRATIAVERLAGPILVFDVVTGKELFTIPRPRSDSTAFGFTPDGKHLAYITRNEDDTETVLRGIDVRDRSTVGSELKPKAGEFSNARALAFSRDGKRLAVSSAHVRQDLKTFQSCLHRWEWPSGKHLPMGVDVHLGTIEAIRFTSSGKEILAITDMQRGWTWDWDTLATTNNWTDDVEGTSFGTITSGHGNTAVSAVIAGWNEATSKSSLHFWRSPSLYRHQVVGSSYLASLALSEDGSLVAAGNKGVANIAWEHRASIRVWDTKDGQARAVLLGHTDWILDLAFAPGGNQLISASKDGTLLWWNIPVFMP